MSEELQKKLPDGVAVVFFENIGNININGKDFRSSGSAGYFAVAYTYTKDLIDPSEEAPEKFPKEENNLFAFVLTLTLLTKEEKDFVLFGTREELASVQKELRESFGTGLPLIIRANTEQSRDCLSWWPSI